MKSKLTYSLLVLIVLTVGFLGGRRASADNPAPAAPPARFIWVASSLFQMTPAGGAAPKSYSIAVFQDTSNSNLIYMTETGAISVVAAPK